MGWELRIRSRQEVESKTCVASLMIWLNLNCEAICSVFLPSKVVWSVSHQFVDFTLKLPITAKKKKLFYTKLSKALSKFSQKLQKMSWDWLGDL